MHGNQGDVKVDWSPTEKDHFFARYSQQHIDNPIVNSEPLLYSGTGSNVFPLQQAVLDYTRTISPTLVNDFRVGMNYFPAEANTQALSTTAGANLIPGQPTQYLPGLSFASSKLGGQLNGPFAFGTTDSPEIFHQTSIQVSDTAIWTKGAHTLPHGFPVDPLSQQLCSGDQQRWRGRADRLQRHLHRVTPKPISFWVFPLTWATDWDSPEPWASATTRSARSCRTTGALSASSR